LLPAALLFFFFFAAFLPFLFLAIVASIKGYRISRPPIGLESFKRRGSPVH
jgi:hypothetical protein